MKAPRILASSGVRKCNHPLWVRKGYGSRLPDGLHREAANLEILRLKVLDPDLGIQVLVPSLRYRELGNKMLVPRTWGQDVVPGSWFQVQWITEVCQTSREVSELYRSDSVSLT